jgi:hypothetical protein
MVMPRTPGPVEERRAAVRAARRRHRQRRSLAATLLLVAAVLVGADLLGYGPGADRSHSGPPPPPDADTPADGDPTPPGYPESGSGEFRYAEGTGPVLGSAGKLRRYRVAVEEGLAQPPGEFASEVDGILGDERGWIASEELRLQRVPRTERADFTVFLASPETARRRCAAGGLHTDGYASCRLPGELIINVARWTTGVPDYGAPLSVYQAFALNHELGHQLGYRHEMCPGPGAPASVMQQQTYGRQGCRANGWPYLDGRRHAGPPVP